MTSDLISRKDFIERYCEENCGERKCWDSFEKCTFILALLQQPTVDAAPVVHEEWIDGTCNNCGQVDFSKPNYCPNCGAKMDGGNNNEMDSM